MKNRLLTYFGVLTSILLLQCKNPDVPVSQDSTGVIALTADISIQYQVMDGFGASDAWRCQFVGKNWPIDKRTKIADLLFSQDTLPNGSPSGIGLSIWRFNIGAGSTEQGDNSLISSPWNRTECFLNPDGTYDWTKQQGQQWFLQAAKTRGVEKILGFSNSPPVYFTQNQKAFSAGGWHYNLDASRFDDFALFLTEVADHFKSTGIAIDYLSPFNEPQWDWKAGSDGKSSQEGTPAANNEITTLTKLLSAKLAARQLSTKIAIAEAGTDAYLYQTTDADRGNQIDNFFNSSSSNYIGNLSNVEKTISSHDYFTVWPVSDLISSREAIFSKINSTDASLKFWQSEYCILEAANTDLSDGWNRDLTMKLALYVSRIIHYDITRAHASSWQWWTALSQGDYKDGLIYLDDGTNNGTRDGSQPDYCKNDGYFHDSKLMWALGNYSYFIRPGMKRIAIGSPDITANQPYGLLVSAYLDTEKKKVITVIINYNVNERQVSLHLKNGQLNTGAVDGYVTSGSQNLTKISKLNSDNITLPGNSITTIVAKYN